MRHIDPLLGFALRVIALLPLCLALWYLSAPALNIPLAAITDDLFRVLFPDLIFFAHGNDHTLDLSVRPPHIAAEFDFAVDPLLYSYGLPLFTALVLATPNSGWARLRQWLLGLPWLALVQLWGVVFDTLKTLAFDLGPRTGYQVIALDVWQGTAVALAYQLGVLILPPLIPVLTWAVINAAFIAGLAKKHPQPLVD